MNWKITLADGSTKVEGKHKYQLDWEDKTGVVKKVEAVGVNSIFSCDLETGTFDLDGESHSIAGAKGEYEDRQLICRRRVKKMMMTGSSEPISDKISYVIGYKVNGKRFEAVIDSKSEELLVRP